MLMFSLFNSILYTIYSLLSGSIIYKKNIKIDIYFFVIVIVYIFLFYLKLNYFSNLFSIYFTYILYALNHKIIFKEKTSTILIGSLFLFLIKTGIEIIYAVLSFQAYQDIEVFKTFSATSIIMLSIEFILAILILYFTKEQIHKIIKHAKHNTKKQFIILMSAYFNIFLVFFLRTSNYELNYELMVELVIIIMFSFIIFQHLNQESKMEFLTSHYKETVEYSKLNEKLLKEYKMAMHENNNKLLIIKSMLKGKKKDLEKYLDTLIKENKSIQKNWINDLNFIPIPGVKNFIYFKLMELSELKTILEVFISPELESLNVEDFDTKSLNNLYTILGVVLDNMIEAIKSSNQKLVSIHLYCESGAVCGTFANSFSGVLDLNKLGTMGYSTKGKERGVGLCLLEKTIKSNKRFRVESKIIDNFFVQQIYMELQHKTEYHKKRTIYHQSEKLKEIL